ncbi:serine/threonine-protein kinase RsbW [Microbacterium sp. BK668]|nr:serine/threonine-protein kinase RsbW [Microbacterium sp. BK668]
MRVEGAADPRFIDGIHDALEQLWLAAPEVRDEDRLLFTLAASEVATNIVTHASAGHPIEAAFEASVASGAIEAAFTDNADPAPVSLLNATMPGTDAESGRGLALALAALDAFTHEGSGGNVWRLRRTLRP